MVNNEGQKTYQFTDEEREKMLTKTQNKRESLVQTDSN